ncbi:MATE family efflux transporter [Mycoplasma marinum]|nr:MATE family efflux transporter [Mycoplasma marinum]
MIKENKIFWKKSLKIIIPVVLSQMLIIAVGFVDNFMITGYDSAQNHLTAVGAGAEMWFGFSSIYISIGILFSIFYAQFSCDKDKFTQTFKINIHFSFGIMIITSLIMFFLAQPIINLFFMSDDSTNSQIAFKIAVDYFKILALGNIFVSVSYLLLNPLITLGKTKYLLIVSAISLLTNTLFDYIFIYPLDLGATGAAISTSGSFFIQMILSIIIAIKNKSIYSNFGSIFLLDKKLTKIFLKRSWMILSFSLMNASFVALTILWSNMFGSELMKSMAIAYAISSVMFTIFPAINQSVKIIIGSELGKGEFAIAKQYSKKLVWPIFVVSTIVVIFGIISGATLPKYLINGQHYKEMAQWMIYTYSTSLYAFAINSYYSCLLEAGGGQLSVSFLNYFTQIWLVIPLAIICGPWVIGLGFKWTFFIAQMSMFSVALASFLVYLRFNWLNNLNEHKDLA